MIFFKISSGSCQKLAQILAEFSRLSRLKINRNKSSIWFSWNTPMHIQKSMADLIEVKVVDKIGKYLGSYMDCTADKRTIGKEIIQKISKKLQGWKS